MPNFDTDSVILTSSLLSVSFGFVILAFAQRPVGLKLHWGLAALSYGVAGLLIGFRGVLPPWLAIVVANMLVGLSVVLIHRGVWLLVGRRPPDRLYAVAVLALGAGYAWFTYHTPDVPTRLFLVSMFRVPFFLSALAVLVPQLRGQGGRGALPVLVGLLVLWTGWYLARALLALSSADLAVMLRTGALQGVNFLLATGGHLLVPAALFRYETERSVARAESLARDLERERDRLEGAVLARTQQLRAAAEEAERANRAKSHFLAAASHDLRQPMQALRLFVDLLTYRLAGTPDAKVVGLASTALASSEGLLHALLDVSKLDAGTVQVAAQPVELGELVTGLLEETAGSARQRGLHLSGLPCGYRVMSDPVLLQRILRNLLHNALRYTERGRILVGCRRDGARVRIEVWDTGMGIPADKLDQVFEDFYQLGNPERDQTNGLGLGLAIVRRVARLLGHEVAVRSWPGRGTVFTVTVPLA